MTDVLASPEQLADQLTVALRDVGLIDCQVRPGHLVAGTDMTDWEQLAHLARLEGRPGRVRPLHDCLRVAFVDRLTLTGFAQAIGISRPRVSDHTRMTEWRAAWDARLLRVRFLRTARALPDERAVGGLVAELRAWAAHAHDGASPPARVRTAGAIRWGYVHEATIPLRAVPGVLHLLGRAR